MLFYTAGVIICTLGANWLIEDMVNLGWQKIYLVYVVCIVYGLLLMSWKFLNKKGGH